LNGRASARWCSTISTTASNCRRPFSTSRRASSSGSAMSSGDAALLLRSIQQGSAAAAALQGLGLLVDHFASNALVLDLRIAVSEATALLFFLRAAHLDLACTIDQGDQFFSHVRSPRSCEPSP